MYWFLRAYRQTLNAPIPSFLKRVVAALGSRIHQSIFAHRHTRLLPFPFRIQGTTFTLFLDWQDYTDAHLIAARSYESETAAFMLAVMRQGGVFIDAGANVGYFSVLIAATYPSAKVIAIEPSARNCFILEKNVAENGLSNLSIMPCAVGDTEGSRELSVKLLNSGSGSLVGHFGRDPVVAQFMQSETVPVTTLDAVAAERGISTVTCMKLDIQGAELEALRGAQRLLTEQAIQYLIIEYNEDAYAAALVSELTGHGYAAHAIKEDGSLVPVHDLIDKENYVFTPMSD